MLSAVDKRGNKMGDKKILKLVLAAMFASMVCVATMVIKIPTPTNGYVNLGDCIVLLSGWLLGPVYGVAAAAVGSMLADLFAGYPAYAAATFVIKGIVAFLAWLILGKRGKRTLFAVVSAVFAEVFMVLSYFLFEWLLMGQGLAAAVGIPANLIQGLVGAVLALALFKLFTGSRALSDFFSHVNKEK